MSVSDADLARIRRTGTYRAAVWLARLAFVLGLGWAWLLLAVRPSGLVMVLTWLVFAAPALYSLVLLHRSGIRFTRRLLSWRLEDERMMWQLYRDMLWFRRPQHPGDGAVSPGGDRG